MGGKQGAAGYGPLTISTDIVRYSEDHIRKSDFSTDLLRDTIADAGLLQPILARKEGDGFVVVDGARRLAALRELGVQELIVGRDIVIDAEETEADVRFKQIIANVQREDLEDVELGQAFVTLKESFGYQYNEIAEIIGKTPHFVTAKVGLVKRLDPEVRRLYTEGTEGTEATDDLCGNGGNGNRPEKCIQNTFSDKPYAMNINVLEDIARVPREAQLAAYREIRECRMDKEMAIAYLRTVKNGAEATALRAQDGVAITLCTKKSEEPDLRRHILKISRAIERLAGTMQGQARVEPAIDAEIDALIERLNALRARGKADTEAAGCEMEPDQA
jgi:ParB family chromosome partitioning protein